MSDRFAIDLNGRWELGWSDGRRGDAAFRTYPPEMREGWPSVTVPGEIHRYLENQGVLAPIGPGLGALSARWVDDVLWYLTREFVVDEAWIGMRAELVFERLELDARIYLNDELVAGHHDAFVPLRVDVTGRLVPGSNALRVELDGGLRRVSDLPARGYRNSADQTLTKRHWLRTGQSQFGWDWAPRLICAGITEPVRLELRTTPLRIDEVVPLVRMSDDLRSACVTCRVVSESCARTELDVQVTASIEELGATVSRSLSMPPGTAVHDLELRVESPELWWPRELGGQRLYRLTVTLAEPSGIIDARSRTIGFRSVVIDQSRRDDGGRHFRLIVNGVAVFAKGANWVPLSLTPHPVDTDLLEKQLDLAVEANLTVLRVWGGGDYESEAFYRGCDERGLLVWQDFPFACGRYPLADPAFRRDVLREASVQVRRLAAHPSLTIWAGNNENAWIGLAEGWPGPLVLPEDGVTREELIADLEFFETDLAVLVRAEDPTRHYQPSSPWSPDDGDPNAFHEGDQHVWQVGFGDVDFLSYRDMDATFPNEGGLLGPTTLPSVLESLPEGQRFYDSFAWKAHDNQVAQLFADRPMERLLAAWTGKQVRLLSLAEYVYWTGLIQAEALTEYIDNFRHRFGTTSAAAIFWMFNDCWPAVRSWSIVDHAARRNPAFHPVRRAFQPIRVIVVPDDGGALVYGCNDTAADQTLELEWGTCTLSGRTRTRRRPVRLPAGRTGALERIPELDDDLRSQVHVAMLRRGETLVSRDRLLNGPFAELSWSEPAIEFSVVDGVATFLSPRFVLGVCVDLDGANGIGDNFFDLYPGVPHLVEWNRTEPPRVLFTGNTARPAV